MAKRYRIITRKATNSEWLNSHLGSSATFTSGFFIQERKFLCWRVLKTGEGRRVAGYYSSQAQAESDLGEYIVAELKKACQPRGPVASFKVDFTLAQLAEWEERQKNVKALR